MEKVWEDRKMLKKFFSFRLAAIVICGSYVMFTLPSALLLGQSEFYRFVTIEQLSHKLSKFRSPEYVFIGDSITAGGRNWWIKLGSTPFSSINLATSGYTIRQIQGLLLRAIEYRPKSIFVMAGTNDLFDPGKSDDDIKADWLSLIAVAQDKNFDSLVITGIPITADSSYDSRIEELNSFLNDLSIKNGYSFIDINQSINQSIISLSPEISRNQFFVDSVHLSDKAYELWVEEIHKILDGEP